jgi:hypothetical protein
MVKEPTSKEILELSQLIIKLNPIDFIGLATFLSVPITREPTSQEKESLLKDAQSKLKEGKELTEEEIQRITKEYPRESADILQDIFKIYFNSSHSYRNRFISQLQQYLNIHKSKQKKKKRGKRK